jgi:ribose/xylose/arabinose/galactoside ABC-type transport system permease subunit
MLAALAVLGALARCRRSRLGLLVRAVNQDRMMASACGIDAGRVDLAVFCLGSGIAGMAGVMLALLGPVTPNVGQGYIVPAFLVVVMGGLGSILGTTIAALILGLFLALSQIFVDVSIAQMLMLVFVIVFIQFRPQGVALPAREHSMPDFLQSRGFSRTLPLVLFALAAAIPFGLSDYDTNLVARFLAMGSSRSASFSPGVTAGFSALARACSSASAAMPSPCM